MNEMNLSHNQFFVVKYIYSANAFYGHDNEIYK